MGPGYAWNRPVISGLAELRLEPPLIERLGRATPGTVPDRTVEAGLRLEPPLIERLGQATSGIAPDRAVGPGYTWNRP